MPAWPRRQDYESESEYAEAVRAYRRDYNRRYYLRNRDALVLQMRQRRANDPTFRSRERERYLRRKPYFRRYYRRTKKSRSREWHKQRAARMWEQAVLPLLIVLSLHRLTTDQAGERKGWKPMRIKPRGESRPAASQSEVRGAVQAYLERGGTIHHLPSSDSESNEYHPARPRTLPFFD